MAAATELATTAPDDFRRRVLARSVFVYCHEFIRWGRRAKNVLKSRRSFRDNVRELTVALDQLEKRDWGGYEQIRHRIAHRQSFGPSPVESISPANEQWTDISDDAVRILSEDARAIWNRLAAIHDMPRLETFPPIDPDLGPRSTTAATSRRPTVCSRV